MRTNIVLEEDIVREAFKYSKDRTKKDLIHEALKEFFEKQKGVMSEISTARYSLRRTTITKHEDSDFGRIAKVIKLRMYLVGKGKGWGFVREACPILLTRPVMSKVE
ncbi:MAG: type II toxin-antitoxin system VapB family antitoxin [Candidatus Brocadia sp.]|nr:type II toxin-antitoxin system VapB family antitoxin [Candidatus Brocadia sp.]